MSEDNSPYDSYDSDVGVDSDEDKKYGSANRLEWFKGEKGRAYRIALVYFHGVDVTTAMAAKEVARKAGRSLSAAELDKVAKDALAKRAGEIKKSDGSTKKPDELTDVERLDVSHVKFKRFEGYYKDGLGYVISRLGKDGPEADVAWRSLGEVPKSYYSTVALFYAADNDGNLLRKDGELDKSALLSRWHVKPWRFGPKNFDSIWSVNKGLRSNDLTIADQDLILKCENTEYQNFKITGGGKATWRRSPELQRRVLETAIGLYDKLIPFREMSSQDLQIKLGMFTGSKGEDVSADLEGLLEGDLA